ncbi:unnamed protein product, partial [Rotaria sp. Silwood1]
MTSNNIFIIEQMKTFLVHKKDPRNYLTQLLHCTNLL